MNRRMIPILFLIAAVAFYTGLSLAEWVSPLFSVPLTVFILASAIPLDRWF